MTRRRALWLVITVVALPAFAVLIPGSPAYLPKFFAAGGSYDGHTTRYWVKALDDRDATVRHQAIFALGQIGNEAGEAVPALAAILLEDPDPNTRREAALALSKMGLAARTAVLALARALEDEEPWVRMNAAHALAWLKTEARPAIPALTKALQDRSNRMTLAFTHTIQEAAVVALGRASAGTPEAVATLTEALQTADSEGMRSAAALALGHVGPEARPAVPLLRALLQDPSREVRRVAANSLRQIEGVAAATP
jgi:HEAT repeat protein